MERLKHIKELKDDKLDFDNGSIEILAELIDKYSDSEELIAFLEELNLSNFTPEEAVYLAKILANSGKKLNISSKIGDCITKASIGEISDCVSLVGMSVLSSLGVKVVKITSPSYGKFSNTISRLQVFDGFDANVTENRFSLIANSIGCAIYENDGEIAPLDSKLIKMMNKFTVVSLPLIAVSLLAKKIALGANTVIYDVKCGEGGMVKSKTDAYKLARFLVDATTVAGMKSACVVTTLNQPITATVGSLVELREVVKTLSSGDAYFNSDLMKVSKELVEIALILLKKANGRAEASEMFDNAILSGLALSKFREIVEAYGGNFDIINKDLSVLSNVAVSYVTAENDGFMADIDSMGLYNAIITMSKLGGLKSKIDKNAGIVLLEREGEKIIAGTKLARLTYSFNNENFTKALKQVDSSIMVRAQKPKLDKLLVKVFV